MIAEQKEIQVSYSHKLWGDGAGFIISASGLKYGQGWKGVRVLGKGSFGVAGLWQKTDCNGTVVDVSPTSRLGTPQFVLALRIESFRQLHSESLLRSADRSSLTC